MTVECPACFLIVDARGLASHRRGLRCRHRRRREHAWRCSHTPGVYHCQCGAWGVWNVERRVIVEETR